MLVFEQDSTYPGSHFVCSELCVWESQKSVSDILELELHGCKLPNVGSRN